MDILEYRDYCLSLPVVEESTPFDETTLVFKVGGRMFTYAGMRPWEAGAEKVIFSYWTLNKGWEMFHKGKKKYRNEKREIPESGDSGISWLG